MTTRRHRTLLVLIVVLAAALRLAWLGRDGLWTDEATTVVLAEQPMGELFRSLRADVQAPVHYLLVKAAITTLRSDDEWVPRLLSALAGIATVALCGVFGRKNLGESPSLLAALLLALQPLHVAYSREARAYALLGLASLLAFVAVDRLRRDPTTRKIVLAALAVGLLPLVHPLGGVEGAAIALAAALPAPHAIAPWRVRALKPLLVAGLASLALAAPWLVATTGQGSHARVAYAWARPAWDAAFPWQVPLSLLTLAPGVSAPQRSLWDGPEPADLVGGSLALLLLVAALALRRRLPDASAPVRLAGAVVGALGLVFAASLAIGPLHVVGRVEAGLAPLFALALAGGAAALKPRAQAVLACLIVVLSLAPLRTVLFDDIRSHERLMARELVELSGGRGTVVVQGAYQFALRYELHRRAPAMRVIGYPADRQVHPSWIDWSAQSEDALRRQADDVVARARDGLDGDLWAVTLPEPGLDPLHQALAARFRRIGRAGTPFPAVSIERWSPQEP